MANVSLQNNFLAALKTPSSATGIPPWLSDFRAKAGAYLDAAALPGAKDEEWKYTSLAELSGMCFETAGRFGASQDLHALLSDADINIVTMNGAVLDVSEGRIPSGVRILTGPAAFSDAALKGAFEFKTRNDSELFLSLNGIHCPGVVVIDVPKGLKVAPVIHLLHGIDDGGESRAFFPRIFISQAEGASLKVFETYSTKSGCPVFVNGVTDICLGEGASLELVQAVVAERDVFHVSSTRVRQARASQLRSFQFTNGARLFRNNLSVLLEGEGAGADINGLHQLAEGRHADSHTFVEHRSPQTTSNQLYKAILDVKSHSVFNGKIQVAREAQLTNSYQLNRNLILSREARVDTKPQLEIGADDVKCSHGATIGQMDDEQLFYLASRGISKESAKAMLARGFVDDVVSRVAAPELRQKLKRIMG